MEDYEALMQTAEELVGQLEAYSGQREENARGIIEQAKSRHAEAGESDDAKGVLEMMQRIERQMDHVESLVSEADEGALHLLQQRLESLGVAGEGQGEEEEEGDDGGGAAAEEKQGDR